MSDMTMGQRIAEERRKLALSQEGLGEKMGVSRQAISKWESDGAVPEIDKLIALSRLFGVSVGWLLGVEDTPSQKEPTDTLSDEQLYMIDEIVKKYQPRPVSKKILLAGILCAILMAASILVIGIRQGNILARVASNDTELYALRAQVNNNQAALEARINAAQTVQNPANPLLAEYHLDIIALISSEADVPAAQIGFSAMPNKWQSGDTGFLSIRREGMETVQLECAWDGAFLTADTILEVEDGYEFCFTLLHADGTQEQQAVSDPEVENLKKTLAVSVEILSVGYSTQTDPLRLTDFEYRVSMPSAAYSYGNLSWEMVELVLVTGKGETLGRYVLLDAEEETDSSILRSPEIVSKHMEIIFENLQLPKNEGIQLWLRAELSNSLSTEDLVHVWVVNEDGTLRSQ